MPLTREETMERNREAHDIKQQLMREDDLITVSEIIKELDEDMAKRVLKLFVYES